LEVVGTAKIAVRGSVRSWITSFKAFITLGSGEPSTSLGTTTLLHAKEKRWTARELKRRNIPSARVHQSLDSRTASAKRNRKRKTLNLPQNRVVFELAAVISDDHRASYARSA
jgi:hypothetical protein